MGNASPCGLDFAIREVKCRPAGPAQGTGKLKLQAGGRCLETSPLAFIHADGQEYVDVIFRGRRRADGGIARARLVEIEEIHTQIP